MKFSVGKYAAVSAILMVLAMTVLDVTVVNVALPVVADGFGISDSDSVWIITAYQLVITMLLLPLSSIGDQYSYRRNFLTGVAVFTLGSLLCALSWNFVMIVVARVIQGVGAACVMSVNIALTRLIYPRNILGRGLALNTMVIAIATAAGPTISGAVLSVASWHWLFIINIPFGIAAFVIGKRLLPHNPEREKKPGIDWVGGIENMFVFGLLFYATGNITRKGDLGINLVIILVGLAIGVLYVRRQLHRDEPMLPVDLFRIRLYTLSISTSVCSFMAQNVSMISLPFLFLDGYGFSELATGLLITPWPLATMIVSPLAARFVEKHNPGVTAAVGMAVFSAGILLLLFMPAATVSKLGIAWRMAVCGVGFGLFQTPNNIVMVLATPVRRTGSAGGMQSTARLVGQTTGAILATMIFAGVVPGSAAVRVCLYVAAVFAVVSGIFSLSRAGKIKECYFHHNKA